MLGTQGTVLCVLTKDPNKHHGARSKSLPAPCFLLFPLFMLFFTHPCPHFPSKNV